MKLFVKYMVSLRCKNVVKEALTELNIPYKCVALGEIELSGKISTEKRLQLQTILLQSGLELIDDRKAILIGKIKSVIVEMVHYEEGYPRVKFSEYLSQKLQYDYTYLSNLFSEITGTTIEHYLIAHKIEKVKELLIYDELSLTQIAYTLHYSSVAHLSNQFKKVTGLTPTFFKQLKVKKRNTLEDL